LKNFGAGLLVVGKICFCALPFMALELYWEHSLLAMSLIIIPIWIICGLGAASRKLK